MVIVIPGPLQQRLRADGLSADFARKHGQVERQRRQRRRHLPGDCGKVLRPAFAAEGRLLPGAEARSLPGRRQSRLAKREWRAIRTNSIGYLNLNRLFNLEKYILLDISH